MRFPVLVIIFSVLLFLKGGELEGRERCRRWTGAAWAALSIGVWVLSLFVLRLSGFASMCAQGGLFMALWTRNVLRDELTRKAR